MTRWQRALTAVVLDTRFYVTEREYHLGMKKSGCLCPVALAIKQELGTASVVSICAATIRIDNIWFMTPKIVDDYIKAYDRGDDACYLLDFKITDLA